MITEIRNRIYLKIYLTSCVKRLKDNYKDVLERIEEFAQLPKEKNPNLSSEISLEEKENVREQKKIFEKGISEFKILYFNTLGEEAPDDFNLDDV